MFDEIEKNLADPKSHNDFIQTFCDNDSNLDVCMSIFQNSTSERLQIFATRCFSIIFQRISQNFEDNELNEFLSSLVNSIFSTFKLSILASHQLGSAISKTLTNHPKCINEFFNYILHTENTQQILISIILVQEFISDNEKPYFSFNLVPEDFIKATINLCINNIKNDMIRNEAFLCLATIVSKEFDTIQTFVSDANLIKELLNQILYLKDRKNGYEFLRELTQLSPSMLNPCNQLTQRVLIDRTELPDNYLLDSIHYKGQTSVVSIIIKFVIHLLHQKYTELDIFYISDCLSSLSKKITEIDPYVVQIASIIHDYISKNVRYYFQNDQKTSISQFPQDFIMELVSVIGMIANASSNQALTDVRRQFLEISHESVEIYLKLLFTNYTDREIDISELVAPVQYLFQVFHHSFYEVLTKIDLKNLNEKKIVTFIDVVNKCVKIQKCNSTDTEFSSDKKAIITIVLDFIENSEIQNPFIENSIALFVKSSVENEQHIFLIFEDRLFTDLVTFDIPELQKNIILAFSAIQNLTSDTLQKLSNLTFSDIDVLIELYKLLFKKMSSLPEFMENMTLQNFTCQKQEFYCLFIGFLTDIDNMSHLNLLKWFMEYLKNNSLSLFMELPSFIELKVNLLSNLSEVSFKFSDKSFLGYDFVTFLSNFLTHLINFLMEEGKEIEEIDEILLDIFKIMLNMLSFKGVNYSYFTFYKQDSIVTVFNSFLDLIGFYDLQRLVLFPNLLNQIIKFLVKSLQEFISVLRNMDLFLKYLDYCLDFCYFGLTNPMTYSDAKLLMGIFMKEPFIDLKNRDTMILGLFNMEKLTKLFEYVFETFRNKQKSKVAISNKDFVNLFVLDYNYFESFVEINKRNLVGKEGILESISNLIKSNEATENLIEIIKLFEKL
ncbi:hypothetical protein TVAG_131040 [Trichomonas vaginalis G3]|uniref:Uncharacterized protein n=1 Tax=Trichomonas vaginalis (strain ATCC PRA-98 / G3) TaxID=412133 RepID=A2EPM7_TRIV3|nr:hypothetical protein TVAGG3_0603140 [Trichomonas vaginalis G3]EAY05370.1 hypothetical protein TVAG_131040 [Trichomonas vaginalis G3]KAI5524053.1 hypothetical protein TVAGG3_0603140 [Trichomonas vaginalis G3]|eukprot:XP_001317593.1 hypothetical protein [Trichomonas vaginalis G3]